MSINKKNKKFLQSLSVLNDVLQVIKLYNYPVRKISKSKIEHHKASLVIKHIGVYCMTEAIFFLIQQSKTVCK